MHRTASRPPRRPRPASRRFETPRQMLALLSHAERRRLAWLLPAITGNAIIQVLGIVSVMPFLSLVANPNAIEENAYLRWTYDTLGFGSANAFLVFVGLGVLAVLVISNGFAAWTQFRLLRFSWDVNHSLSVRMLREYLSKPYAFFLDQNSSGLAKNILGETKQVVRGYLVAGTNLVAHGFVAVFVLGLLVVVDPLLALVALAFLGSAYGAVYLFVRRGMSEAGRRRSQADRERYQAANEALTGVKEIKLLGKERPFLDRYAVPSRRYARFMARQQVIGTLPRYAFETIAFGGLLVIVLYLLIRGGGAAQVLPTLGVYAFASYRLLPSLQHIFSAVTNMRFSASAVELLHRDLDRRATDGAGADRESVEALPFERSLEFRNLTFTYPNAHEPVLEDFGLRIEPNTSVAFVGATGSGKTTTVDVLLGLLAPADGALVVDDTPVTKGNLAAWQKNLGYVPQQIHLADDTVAANIAFGVDAEAIDTAAVEHAARRANIHDFVVERLPDGYATRIGERGVRLSGGQRQRLGIARALYFEPKILVLDEATNALDPMTEEAIFHSVRDIGRTKTVIMIAHRLSTVRDCDVIYLLDGGRIVASGDYDALVRTSPAFRQMVQASGGQFVTAP